MARKNSLKSSIPNNLVALTTQEIIAMSFGFLLLLTPLLSTGLAPFSGVYDQNMWIVAITGTFLVVGLLQWLRLSQRSFQWNLIDLLALGWGIWLLITTLTSINPTDSWFGGVHRTGSLSHWLALLTIYFLMRRLVPSFSSVWQTLQTTIIYSGTAVAIVGLAKLALGTQTSPELIGLLGNQNFTAYYLAITLVTTYVYWLTNRLNWRDPAILALLIQVVAIWYTNAKWIYFVVPVILIAILIVAIRHLHIHRAKQWLTAGLVGAGVITILGSFWLGGQAYFNFNFFSFTNRLHAWEVSWQASLDRPLFGWGLENYDNAFQANFQPKFEDAVGSTETLDRAHNFIFDYLVFTGWLGLILLLTWLGMAIAIGWQHIGKNPLAIWAIGVVITYICINLLGYETIATTALLMLALAYLGTLSKPIFTMPTRLIHPYVGLVGIALTIVLTMQFVIMPWIATRRAWQSALQFDLTKFNNALEIAPYLKPELAYYLIVPAYFPTEDMTPEFAGRLANYLEQIKGHRDDQPGYHLAIVKAWEMSNSPNRLQKMKNNLVAGMATYDNNNGYYWAFLSAIELKLGNTESALSAIERAKQLNPNSKFTADTEAYILSTINEQPTTDDTT